MIDWNSFTPLTAAVGGALIALSATVLMLGIGRIAGISGIVRQAIVETGGARAWRLTFLAGIVLSAGLTFHLLGFDFELRQDYPRWLLVVGGLLVGYGTAMGGGCTSGHGVCGLARFSGRSLAATLTFVGVGMVTVFVMRHLLGGVG